MQITTDIDSIEIKKFDNVIQYDISTKIKHKTIIQSKCSFDSHLVVKYCENGLSSQVGVISFYVEDGYSFVGVDCSDTYRVIITLVKDNVDVHTHELVNINECEVI